MRFVASHSLESDQMTGKMAKTVDPVGEGHGCPSPSCRSSVLRYLPPHTTDIITVIALSKDFWEQNGSTDFCLLEGGKSEKQLPLGQYQKSIIQTSSFPINSLPQIPSYIN